MTNWPAVAASLASACPSAAVRADTINVLQRLEHLGGPLRAPDTEFRRVYRSLQWNDVERIKQIIVDLLPLTQKLDPPLVIRADAWGYVVNDPNDWATEHQDPQYILNLVKRVVRVSVETVKIVRGLPPLQER